LAFIGPTGGEEENIEKEKVEAEEHIRWMEQKIREAERTMKEAERIVKGLRETVGDLKAHWGFESR
jgi:wobble nucleotide-excising tRNase